MRIRFIKRTDVSLDQIPNAEWGRLQKRVEQLKPPEVDTVTNGFKPPEYGPILHYFPIGVTPDLPNGQAFIDSGAAEAYDGPEQEEPPA